ncbi:hypothetical protein [Xanthobacter sediminis]
MILSQAVRDAVTCYPDGRREAAWQEFGHGGVQLSVCLRHAPQQTLAYNGRAALTYVVAGEVVEGRDGFRCEGRAILDLKTRAFLHVECALIPVGQGEPAS